MHPLGDLIEIMADIIKLLQDRSVAGRGGLLMRLSNGLQRKLEGARSLMRISSWTARCERLKCSLEVSR